MKPKISTLKNRAEKLWKEACALKYGKFCHVRKYYPEIKIKHTSVIQIDHFISRSNGYFKFDIRNGLPVCSSCNSAKAWHNKSIGRAIDTLVKSRDPKWFDDAVFIDQSGEPNVNFSKRWWLLEIITDLEKIIKGEK